MIEVHLYGSLRRFGPGGSVAQDCVVKVEAEGDQLSVGDLAAKLGIPLEEVASVFCDGKWQIEGVATPLRKTTRLGIFPPKMALLYV